MKTLTSAGARALTKPGMYRADPTLYLNVALGGSKSWIQRVAVNGKRRDIGLGPFPVIGLAEARRRAFANRVAIAEGRDPLAEKRRAKVPTFRQAAERTFEANRPRWRSAKVAANWMQQMERHAFPRLANLAVDQIGREDVLSVLTPLWTAKPEIARKLRQRIRATLRWCEAHGYIEVNVAAEGIDGALPTMPAVREHLRALPHGEVAGALETVAASRASIAAKACFRFVVLTACRGGEARGATWDEVHEDACEWRIPGARMKGGVDHRVPLSDPALAVLKTARSIDDGSGLVFPSPTRTGKPMSDMTLTKVLRDCGLAQHTTVHGLRSSFRDWCAETGKPREIAEAALAHAVGGVEGAYFRSDLFERRRRLMADWARYLTGDGADVVSLHG